MSAVLPIARDGHLRNTLANLESSFLPTNKRGSTFLNPKTSDRLNCCNLRPFHRINHRGSEKVNEGTLHRYEHNEKVQKFDKSRSTQVTEKALNVMTTDKNN